MATASNLAGALNPMTTAKTMAPGIKAILDWNLANGFESMMNQPAPPPVELPSSHARQHPGAAAGQQLGPHEQLKLIHEGYEAAEEMRRQSIRAARRPEMRDSPEGVAVTEAITMATDVTNYIPTGAGGPAAKAGRKLLLEEPHRHQARSPRGGGDPGSD